MCERKQELAPKSPRCRPELFNQRKTSVSGNELLALGALAVACLFASGILLRSWRRRRTRPPLVAAVLVLIPGGGADGQRGRRQTDDGPGRGLALFMWRCWSVTSVRGTAFKTKREPSTPSCAPS